MSERRTKDHRPRERNQEIARGADKPGRSEIEDIIDEASHRDADGILRQTLRGDESKGDADDRDIVGATDFKDTPHGREETKNDKAGAANQNG
jgi:hypothetical protein